MIYIQLFLSFVQIGMFSFGGGYAALPLIQNQVTEVNSWLSIAEFTDLITISQMTPGPIAINAATFVGMKIAGFGGAVFATLGCVLPSCIIVSLLAFIYFRYKNLTVLQGALWALRPAVVAMIASAGLSIIISAVYAEGAGGVKIYMALIFAAAVLILRSGKMKPISVMVLCGAARVGLYFFGI
jgi:chromate transporter